MRRRASVCALRVAPTDARSCAHDTDTGIHKSNFRALCKQLGTHTMLRELSVGMRMSKEVANDLAAMLTKTSSLRRLDLSEASLAVGDEQHLIYVIESSTTLVSVGLWANQFFIRASLDTASRVLASMARNAATVQVRRAAVRGPHLTRARARVRSGRPRCTSSIRIRSATPCARC